MSKRSDRPIDAVANLSMEGAGSLHADGRRDDDQSLEPIDPAFREGILEGLAEVRLGAFVDPVHVEMFFRRHGA